MTPAEREQAIQRREDQARRRDHAQALLVLGQLRALEEQWKTTRATLLREIHDGLYLPAAALPQDLEVAITYWSTRATMLEHYPL